MSRSEGLRAIIGETNSTLVNHSLNQKKIKENIDGENRIDAQRSRHLAQLEKEKSQRESEDYHLAKVTRIATRVHKAFSGYDGLNFQVLTSEIKFLKSNGFSLKSLAPQKPETSE